MNAVQSRMGCLENTLSTRHDAGCLRSHLRTPVELAADKMRTAGVHRALVIDEDALIGIVTTTDIADAVADHRLTADRSPGSTQKPDQRLER